MARIVERFLQDERGATAIEYAMVAAGIAVAISVAVYALGERVLNDLWNRISTAMT